MTNVVVNPRQHHAVDRGPAPDEPLPLTEREADHVGERSARH